MNDIKRQKITERLDFEYDDLLHIASKSNERCCHCGKKVYFGYGATVEHFIPISKGGTNQDINLVMLCKDCNESKGSFIYEPDDYLEFLNDGPKEKLKGYFDSFIHSFDFVNRDNILACDRYKLNIPVMNYNLHHSVLYRKNGKNYNAIATKTERPIWIQKATIDDADRISNFFIKYLKKYNSLSDEEVARINILFWLTFGCIYYIEKDGEIKNFAAVTVAKADESEEKSFNPMTNDAFLTVHVFSYYKTDFSIYSAYTLSRFIADAIMDEQNVHQIPIRFDMLTIDPATYMICDDISYQTEHFTTTFYIFHNKKRNELDELNKNNALHKFFNKFARLNGEKLATWFEKHGTDSEDYKWMIDELAVKFDDIEDDDDYEEEVING